MQVNILTFFTHLGTFMFDIQQMKLELGTENEVLLKNISLDDDLDCYLLINGKEKKVSTFALNTILDAIIGNISKKDTYKDFSRALETINHVFKMWEKDGEKIGWLNIFIGIRAKENLVFSTIWNPSWYLIKRDGEIIEVTDKNDTKKEFSFISSGDINDGEVIVIASSRLLDFLSKTDIRESVMGQKTEDILKNIENILKWENTEKNIALLALRNSFLGSYKSTTISGQYLEKVKYIWMKSLDNIVI